MKAFDILHIYTTIHKKRLFVTDKVIEFSPEEMHSNLTAEQKAEAEFLRNLVKVLRNTNLAKLDLKGTSLEDGHREYNILVDNYEISIRRTPVYTYPKKWNRIFCFGKWMFEPDKYERYELDITENVFSARQSDYADKYYLSSQLGNQIMLTGTMATDMGQFNPSKRYINCSDDNFENLFTKQNKHLFDAARDLYFILNTEYELRQTAVKYHPLSVIETPAQRSAVRARLLEKMKGISR